MKYTILLSILIACLFSCERDPVALDSTYHSNNQVIVSEISSTNFSTLIHNDLTKNSLIASSNRLYIRSTLLRSSEDSVIQMTSVNLRNKYYSKDYLDFGYGVYLADQKLHRTKDISGPNIVIDYQFDDSISTPIENIKSHFLFEEATEILTSESKQIKNRTTTLAFDEAAHITNINVGSRLNFSEPLLLKFNKKLNPNTTTIGLTPVNDAIEASLVVRMTEQSNFVIIPKETLAEFTEFFPNAGELFSVWVMETVESNSHIISQLHTSTESNIKTPVIRQSLRLNYVRKY